MQSEKIQVRLPDKVFKKLSKLAEEDKRSISTYVRIMIEAVLEKK